MDALVQYLIPYFDGYAYEIARKILELANPNAKVVEGILINYGINQFAAYPIANFIMATFI